MELHYNIFQEHNYGLYEEPEVEDLDPLHEAGREQLFNDPFWSFPEPTIEDWASKACPPSLPELY